MTHVVLMIFVSSQSLPKEMVTADFTGESYFQARIYPSKIPLVG